MFDRFISLFTGQHTIESAMAPLTKITDRLHDIHVRETAAALAHTAAATAHQDFAIAKHTIAEEAAMFKAKLTAFFA